MSTIKAIEGRTVHQIQSGQVIVDLSSVVKELVENSLDAGATSVDVRFKGNGFESIEVQDNGTGIPPENYPTIALKHYTSKLSTYDDLSSLQTFGFRGEALSSLCALSTFHIVTARAEEAPKGTRLDFETSGELKATSVVASQKGTTVAVEGLFANLPVRRRELEKNIKREYGKVLGVLQAYACISTSVKFSVSSIISKGKKVLVFATKSNPTTRENIANVFGAKTLAALVQMDIRFNMESSHGGLKAQGDEEDTQVRVLGHVSRPVYGEGRQTPDRQMFFVNARPCALPQFAKVFNEIYKSYNLSQLPFVFANIIVDTNAYDVNVSPDKRTILLHEQTALLESLRTSLTELFDKQDHTVPQTPRPQSKLPSFKQRTVHRPSSGPDGSGSFGKIETQTGSSPNSTGESADGSLPMPSGQSPRSATSLIEKFVGRDAQSRIRPKDEAVCHNATISEGKQKLLWKLGDTARQFPEDDHDNECSIEHGKVDEMRGALPNPIADFNERIAEQKAAAEEDAPRPSPESDSEVETNGEANIKAVDPKPPKPALGVVQNAFDRMRPRRQPPQVAAITIGTKTTTTLLGSSPSSLDTRSPSSPRESQARNFAEDDSAAQFSSTMQAFKAPGAFPSHAQSHGTPATYSQRALEPGSSTEAPSSPAKIFHVKDSSNEVSPSRRADSDQESDADQAGFQSPIVEESDEEYLDDEGRKAKQDAKVADLIQQAEETSAVPDQDNLRRAGNILQGRTSKDSTTHLLQILHESVDSIEDQLRSFEQDLQRSLKKSMQTRESTYTEEVDPEKKLSLTVCKEDFSRMHVVGQFNLGFILANRPSTSLMSDDELFIIDQHASDEKFNFERLQVSTTVQNQRLVRPKVLDLTAIEEEIILENNAALLENGFVVEVDQSGDSPVGQRCKLISLPMSREVTFDLSDLEELIALLGESPSTNISSAGGGPHQKPSYIPRPSKVRRLFAMRACRSSVMIGKTLQKRQMEKFVRHMGEIDKPWNCPHGRPTMRHVIGLRDWEGWKEGDGLVGIGDDVESGQIDWKGWLEGRKDERVREGDADEGHGEDEEREIGKESIVDVDLVGVNHPTADLWNHEGVDTDDVEGTYSDDVDHAAEEEDEDEEIEGGESRSRQSISQRFLYS
ncbi:MAG: hypothetical protein Q9188_005486 [Gyalolechia gomerana]